MTVSSKTIGNDAYRRYLLALVVFHQAAAESTGLGGSDYQASNLLDLEGPLTTGELGRRLGLTTGAATRLVDRLVSSGIAARTTDPVDRRRTVIAATGRRPPGLDELLDRIREPIGRAIARLTPEQQRGLGDYLDAATDAYTEQARSLRPRSDRGDGADIPTSM